jgi:hypothetical protein
MKKIPMRSCIVTHEKLNKKDLIRVVKNKNNEVFIDLTGKANGRGAYLKKDLEVIKKCKKNKILDRKLEIDIPENIYEELINMI